MITTKFYELMLWNFLLKVSLKDEVTKMFLFQLGQLSSLLFCFPISGSLEVNGNKVRKKLMAPDISLTLDPSEGSVWSDDLDEGGEVDLEGLDTPSEHSDGFEWEGNPLLSCELILHNVYLVFSLGKVGYVQILNMKPAKIH